MDSECMIVLSRRRTGAWSGRVSGSTQTGTQGSSSGFAKNMFLLTGKEKAPRSDRDDCPQLAVTTPRGAGRANTIGPGCSTHRQIPWCFPSHQQMVASDVFIWQGRMLLLPTAAFWRERREVGDVMIWGLRLSALSRRPAATIVQPVGCQFGASQQKSRGVTRYLISNWFATDIETDQMSQISSDQISSLKIWIKLMHVLAGESRILLPSCAGWLPSFRFQRRPEVLYHSTNELF